MRFLPLKGGGLQNVALTSDLDVSATYLKFYDEFESENHSKIAPAVIEL